MIRHVSSAVQLVEEALRLALEGKFVVFQCRTSVMEEERFEMMRTLAKDRPDEIDRIILTRGEYEIRSKAGGRVIFTRRSRGMMPNAEILDGIDEEYSNPYAEHSIRYNPFTPAERAEFDAVTAACNAVAEWVKKTDKVRLIGCTPAMITGVAVNAYKDAIGIP